jgi:hypothetical protein
MSEANTQLHAKNAYTRKSISKFQRLTSTSDRFLTSASPRFLRGPPKQVEQLDHARF